MKVFLTQMPVRNYSDEAQGVNGMFVRFVAEKLTGLTQKNVQEQIGQEITRVVQDMATVVKEEPDMEILTE